MYITSHFSTGHLAPRKRATLSEGTVLYTKIWWGKESNGGKTRKIWFSTFNQTLQRERQTLQRTTAHCSVLQHSTAYCSTVRRIPHTAAHIINNTAAYCSALQSTLQHTGAHMIQNTAAHCSICSTLQHT